MECGERRQNAVVKVMVFEERCFDRSVVGRFDRRRGS
jgi:hypothetical protein